MNSFDIDRLVREGKMNQLFRKHQYGSCMSERLAEMLVSKGVTEFANFAYTDYGCLTGRGGILDYAVIRYFRENYHGDGCEIEGAGYGGDNMILYGDALKHLREEFCPNRDELDDLLQGMTDYISEYERLNFRKQAEDIISWDKKHDGMFAECDADLLGIALEDVDSGWNTNGFADYSETDLIARYKELV